MINVRAATKSDQIKWDSYVQQHNEHTPYHLFAWQSAVTSAYQHRTHCLIAEQDSHIVGILPLVLFNIPIKPLTLCALPYCDVGGILADSPEIYDLLLTESINIGRQHHATLIELRHSGSANQSATNNTPVSEVDTTNSTQKVRMIMPLPETSELLWNGFKSKLRSQIRKAEKNGLTYNLGSSPTLLDDFYEVFAHNMRALGSPVHAKQWFVELLNTYQQNLIISVVYHNGLAIGAGIVLTTQNKASIPWASTKAEYNHLSPNMLLYWSLLKQVSDNQISEFDFGRSTVNEGTYKFKQQWGAQPVLLNWQITKLNSTQSDEQNQIETKQINSGRLRAIVETLWRKLPIKVTILLGPRIRKYISL